MLSEAQALKLYRMMLRIRLFEERVFALAAAKRIYGPAHLYLGQEAVAAETYGPCSAASEVAAFVMEKGFHSLKAPLGRVHFRFAPIPFSTELFKGVVPQADAIV